jgi:hypothetical protein
MALEVEATHENRVFKPAGPVPLNDQERAPARTYPQAAQARQFASLVPLPDQPEAVNQPPGSKEPALGQPTILPTSLLALRCSLNANAMGSLPTVGTIDVPNVGS